MKGFNTSSRAKYWPTQSSRKIQYSMWFIALEQLMNPFFYPLTDTDSAGTGSPVVSIDR